MHLLIFNLTNHLFSKVICRRRERLTIFCTRLFNLFETGMTHIFSTRYTPQMLMDSSFWNTSVPRIRLITAGLNL